MILQNPEIIILDEATSALDVESESKIQESIERLAANKTLIVISHGTLMLKNISRIYTLENGNIVKSGSNHVLSQNK
jgi:ABC-type bacteriocin/lantibiotic exporter with double-glycine peptidase domain